MGFTSKLLIIAAVVAAIVSAQDYRARVQGSVTDTSKAFVVGAKVTLKNINTGIQAVKPSNENGRYLFDFVEPGTYSVIVEQPGFGTFVQENITVQVRGDVTVDAVLKVGAVTEQVVVESSAIALQFNTTTMEMSIDNKMVRDIPIVARNPFTLALLDPAVVNQYGADRNPFYMWGSSQMDVGGATSGKNDLFVDGAPVQLGMKGAYAPPMDAVQEFSVQQNSVNAEFGHSAGGVISVGMKSGSNEFHGTAYYFGRNPALNAQLNSVSHAKNQVRNHIWGGTLGNPIKKNKLFSFFSYEQWLQNQPSSYTATQATALEQTGDFSKSLTVSGGQRTIYDPWTSVFNAGQNTWTRTPFANNVIPPASIDPTSKIFLKDFWLPNNAGDNAAGANNFKSAFTDVAHYRNISERVDWNISDKWKIFGRFSQFRTTTLTSNYTPGSFAFNPYDSGLMNARNIAGDSVYILSPSMVLDVRYSYNNLQDDYADAAHQIGQAGLAKFWPNNPWYKLYADSITQGIYYPYVEFAGTGNSIGRWVTWIQHPTTNNVSASLSRSQGKHYMKAGLDIRTLHTFSASADLMDLRFSPGMTAATWPSPNTTTSGDPYAAFLLGALDGGSPAKLYPNTHPEFNFFAGYFQDDIKVSRRVTLNLGLRYEFSTGPKDPNYSLVRNLDLTQPIPQFQANPPQLPASVTALRTAPPIWNGAWIWAAPGQRKTNGQSALGPRVGLAYRLNDKSVIRVGYARFITPLVLTGGVGSSMTGDATGSMTYDGYSATSTTLPVLAGIPQAVISNPFNAANPLLPALGNSLGTNTNLGGAPTFYPVDLRLPVNDRFNVSLQRDLPGRIHTDVTYFLNLGHNFSYSKNLDMADPNIAYTFKSATSVSVANPFYNILTPTLFPGALRYQASVTVSSLLAPYPQYSSITQMYAAGVHERYQALQVRVQRSFAKGLMYTFAYNFNHDAQEQYFNAPDQYINKWTWIPNTLPRHRISLGYSWDLPFGKGRPYLNSLNPVVNAILGGWSTSGLFMFNTGSILSFGQMEVNGDPHLANPTRAKWFNTAAFSVSPGYTPRMNPWNYPDLQGPKNWNIDNTLSKQFPVTERVQLEFRMEAYNLTNSFIPNNPSTSVTSSSFGRCTNQGNKGRQFQYVLRLVF